MKLKKQVARAIYPEAWDMSTPFMGGVEEDSESLRKLMQGRSIKDSQAAMNVIADWLDASDYKLQDQYSLAKQLRDEK